LIEVKPPDSLRGPRRLAAVLLFASGFSAIAYQVLWIQQSGLWLGQESAAVVAVVAAFLGGLALGSLLAARAVEASRHPARWYAACELVIALWAVVLVFGQQSVDAMLSAWTGVNASAFWQWGVSFGGTLLLLLPATMAMGATLPAMERCLSGLGKAHAFSPLYAANTAGAMAGALGAAFWLVPQLGLMQTALVCGAVNLLCAVGALALPVPASAVSASVATEGIAPPLRTPIPGILLALLFATGWLGIGFELLVVRALSQVAENTVYTYALLLAVYLGGTSIGAALHGRLAARNHAAGLQQALLVALALATAVAVPVLGYASLLHHWLLGLLPQGVVGALFAEAALALLVFLPATFVMGLTFPQLVAEAKRAGIAPGIALAANTLGGSLAPLFTLVLLPLWGLRAALLLASVGYLLLVAAFGSVRSRGWWGGLLAVGLLATLSPPLQFARLTAGAQVLAQSEGRQATVTVIETEDGLRTLHIDNRQQEGSNRSTFADGRQALLPLLLHPAPRHALFLGVGTGVTSSVATLDPQLQVDAVELVPEVIEATRWFADAVPAGADLARRQFIVADARRFVRAGEQSYDLVVADNFHPARSGTGALYSQEHFAAVKRRLAPGGLFCQWLPLHQLDLESLASIVRSYQAVFPEVVAVLATNSLDTPTLGLIGLHEGQWPEEAQIERRLAQLPASVSTAFEFPDALAVAGTVVAGPEALQAFAAKAVANTDDRPVVAYRAPFATYAAEAAPRERLLAVVAEWAPAASAVMAVPASDQRWEERVSRYRRARNLYLQVGSKVRPVSNLQAMLQQVREPLLSVLRVSPEFRPAFGPLWNMAKALEQQDPAAGQALLAELQAIAVEREVLSRSL
jgi:spermidine synthase